MFQSDYSSGMHAGLSTEGHTQNSAPDSTPIFAWYAMEMWRRGIFPFTFDSVFSQFRTSAFWRSYRKKRAWFIARKMSLTQSTDSKGKIFRQKSRTFRSKCAHGVQKLQESRRKKMYSNPIAFSMSALFPFHQVADNRDKGFALVWNKTAIKCLTDRKPHPPQSTYRGSS